MRLHGYCTACRRMRRVTVTPSSLARGGIPVGVCDDCAHLPRRVEGRILSSRDVARCPIRSLEARHYRDDGSCRCPARTSPETTAEGPESARGGES